MLQTVVVGNEAPPKFTGGLEGGRTYLVSCGMASRALPYTLQELCFWQSTPFPPLWSLQTGKSETLNVPLPYSPH